jgi:cellulose synthase/poly-beta-1,6-N-acetylglucosamine synthase-like glycosyltransferase
MLYFILLFLGILLLLLLLLLVLSPSIPPKQFLKPSEFPFLVTKSTLDLSIIIPCYNEQLRLEVMLAEVFEYLDQSTYKTEIIIVDDGSTDKTFELATRIKKMHSNLKILKMSRNRGKGIKCITKVVQ